MLYHGSPHKFSSFDIPIRTGNIREERSHHRDVVFLTNKIQLALEYAGKTGFLYLVDSKEARVYNQVGKKKPTVNKSVFVARPDKISIKLCLQLLPRKRNCEQKFQMEG